MSLGIGIHPGIPEAVYHADPAEEPSASASILRTLYSASPEHAEHDHPRLNPAFVRSSGSEAKDAGTILHAMVLGQPPRYLVVPFDSFRSDKAKAARAQAEILGHIAITPQKVDELQAVADSLRTRLAAELPFVFAALTDAETMHEATLIWREDGVLCRCRFDVLPPAHYRCALDLKFTGRSAEPGEWSKKLRSDYLFQADLYPRGLKALRGDTTELDFVVCETDAPYGVSLHAQAPDLAAIARRRVNVALRRWAYCLQARRWPGYPRLVHYATAPGWLLTQDDEMASRDNFLKDAGELGEGTA